MVNIESSLKSLNELVRGLTQDEIKSVQRFLNGFDDSVGQNKVKTSRLLELTLADEKVSTSRIMGALYENPDSERAFAMLIQRLYDKILECILLEANIERKDAYSEFVMASIDVRKKIMQARILKGRNLNSDILGFYDKIISKAKKFELFDELCEVLELKRLHIGLRFGPTDFDEVTKELEFFNDARKAIAKCYEYEILIASQSEFSSKNDKIIELIIRALSDLQMEFDKTKSANVGYFLYKTEARYFSLIEEFQRARNSYLKVVDIVTNFPAVATKIKSGISLMELSNAEISLYDFHSAITHISLSKTYFSKFSFNSIQASEIEFIANFFSGNIGGAAEILNELTDPNIPDYSPFIQSRHFYLLACVNFLQGKNKDCNILFKHTKEIDKDKEGWNLGVRVLNILNQIELDDVDFAEDLIENLRKHVERTLKLKKDIRSRDIVILKILNELVKESFDFKAVWNKRPNYFELLASNDAEHKWEIKSHELVIFHEWFKWKATGIPYPLALTAPAPTAPVPEEKQVREKVFVRK